MLKHKLLNSAIFHYNRIFHPMTLGVRILLIDSDRIVLVRHTYVSGWHFPGGGVKSGETIYQAIERETHEETGYRLNDMPVLFGVYQNTSLNRRDHVAMFVSRSFRPASAEVPFSREIAECDSFALDSLPDETTEATHSRLAEILKGVPARPQW